MNGSKSRELIYKNMDAMSITMDALDSLIDLKKNTDGHINRFKKIINRGKEINGLLEVNTRQRIA